MVTPQNSKLYLTADINFNEKKPKTQELKKPTVSKGILSVTSSLKEDKPTPASTQCSLITIFTIWNSTMGSSLLTMPWAVEKAGLVPGVIIIILTGTFFAYTTYCIVQVSRDHGGEFNATEVPVLCNMLIGRWAKILAVLFGFLVLLGASIVYLILMTNFLHNSVDFVIDYACDRNTEQNLTVYDGNIIYPNEIESSKTEDLDLVRKIWNKHSTVPVIMGVIMFPCLNCTNITFFTKFTCLATLSVLYLIAFIITKGIISGIHWNAEPIFKSTFPGLTGTLSMSFFIHNMIISILKNNRNQNHNGRDLFIAFALIIITYLIIGGVFYVIFPTDKHNIMDNLFDNFSKGDPMALTARILFLIQISVTYPLVLYLLRIMVFGLFVKTTKIRTAAGEIMEVSSSHHTEIKFPKKWIILFNIVIVVIGILFGCFYPKIGTLIRYVGALGGMVYLFLIPALLRIKSLKRRGKLTKTKLIFLIFIPILGACNLFAQIFVKTD